MNLKILGASTTKPTDDGLSGKGMTLVIRHFFQQNTFALLCNGDFIIHSLTNRNYYDVYFA